MKGRDYVVHTSAHGSNAPMSKKSDEDGVCNPALKPRTQSYGYHMTVEANTKF